MEQNQKKPRIVELLMFVLMLLHESYQQYPTEYCDLGPLNCTVFRCQYYSKDNSTCVFAPYEKNRKVFNGCGGSWNNADINRLNTSSEPPCVGNECCMKEIDPSKTPSDNVQVKMQFLNEMHLTLQDIIISIKHYEECVPADFLFPAVAYLNSHPTQCLNLSHYCNVSSTTKIETTTQIITSGTSDKPTTDNPEAQGLDETQKIEIRNLTIPRKGKLADILFSGVTVDPSLVDDLSEAKIIAAQLQANANITRYTKKTINGDYKNIFEPKPGTPALNLTVVSENNTRRLQAKLSFIINHKNIDATTYILSTISSNISRYGITRLKQVNAACGFFDTTKQQFSTNGCSTTSTTTTSITCFCNHTTVFAILLSVQSYDIPSAVVLLSYITESISILCLIITIVILMTVRKQLRSSRTAMQINLSVAILCLHTFSMFHELALKENRACEVFTIATHFFLLATGTWMFLEGLGVFVMTTKQILAIDKKNPKKMLNLKLIFGWGVPLVYAAGTAAIALPTHRYIDTKPPTYNQYYKCWLGTQFGTHQAAVIIPMAVIYVINIVIAIRVIWFIHKLRAGPNNTGQTERNTKEDVAASVKVFLMLFPVLGLAHIFGILTNVRPYEASVVFMYINVIVNGLQGLFLLLVYCVFGVDVRDAAIRLFQNMKLRLQSNLTSQLNLTKGKKATEDIKVESHPERPAEPRVELKQSDPEPEHELQPAVHPIIKYVFCAQDPGHAAYPIRPGLIKLQKIQVKNDTENKQ